MSDPQKKLSEILTERIDQLQAEIKALKEVKSSTTSTQPSTPEGHKTVAEMLSCPTCGKTAKEALTPKILQEYGNSIKHQETVVCKGCGLHVKRSEEKCPGCGGTESE